MDREKELGHLLHVEKALADNERHIADQEGRVARLDRDGHDTKRSVALLGLYRRLHAQHLAFRRIVLKLIEQDAKGAKPAVGPIFRPGHYDPPPR